MIVVPGQDASSRVLEATYFGRLLRATAMESSGSVTVDQCGSQNLIGAAAEQEVTGLDILRGTELAVIDHVRLGAPALGEPIIGVLTGMAGRLDHAVEGHELDDNQLPHSDLPKVCGMLIKSG